MVEKIKKNLRGGLILLIVVCMGIILWGGVSYVASLRKDLEAQAAQNVLAVTEQQRQALDNFIAGDQERLHSFAMYFSQNNSGNPVVIRKQLGILSKVRAFYTVVNLDTGRYCNNKDGRTYQMTPEVLEVYRALSGSGVREPYQGLYSGDTMFGYYECFTFSDGARGLIQKSYSQNRVAEEFSLSFYNGQGLAYVVNEQGDIMLRSLGETGQALYENIFVTQADADRFRLALEEGRTGSLVLSSGTESYIYTYVPLNEVEGWYLVSIVPERAITTEADEILLNSQQAVIFLVVVLVICATFVMLIWHTQRNIRQKEQEIEYQEQLFDILATYLSRNTDDVYMLVDLETERVEYASPNVERVLGVHPDNITDALRTFVRTPHPSEAGEGQELEYTALRNMAPGETIETWRTERLNPQTGEHKWFRESVYCTLMQGRRKLVLYISDRTQERKAQDALSDALRMAQVANDAKSAFLSSVSHDIRTPMNAIIGFLALMREDADKPELVLDYTQRIDAASQHLLGLINDVLDMNKIESGSATLNVSELDLAEVIDEINAIIRPQTKAKNQSFDIFVSSLPYEHLMGDKLRINQILINLLSNAVKYTPEGGSIQVRVEELSQVVDNYTRVRFTVSDNGLGMSDDYQRVIFDPFTREQSTATQRIQGTGLGMAITKSLVDLMGGSIHVTSALGEGSTFVVELELRIQEQEDDPKFWSDHSVARMIVADDDEEVCRNIVKTMEQTGVETHYATDGQTAIRMMRENREAGRPYDLILLDWKMPNLDGLETARLIRKNYPDKIPILLLTAYDWGEIEQEAMEIGVNHFMPKPFFMSTFKAAIRRLLGGMQKTREDRDNVVQGKHILVVDDIEVNRIILVKILNTLGAQCDTAGNGQEAVDKFQQSPPGRYDIILMDVQMPVMDGYEATRTIRAGGHPCAQTIPIIAMTANAFVDDVRDAIDSGMDAHIAKPVQLDKLKATIRQVLDSRAQPEVDPNHHDEKEERSTI